MEESELEKTYPSTDLAYQIAIASYDTMAKRFDAVDARLQTILAFVVSISAAVPTLAGARGVHFKSAWFFVAAALFVISIVVGTLGRLSGEIQVLSPEKLYQKWLHLPQIDFKTYGIYQASQDFIANRNLVYRKWLCSVWVTILFAAEAAAMAVWVLAEHP